MRTPKSHKSLWGKPVRDLSQIRDSLVRKIFKRILEKDYVKEIILGKFSLKKRGKKETFLKNFPFQKRK